MGGGLSHEYHVLAPVGEDRVLARPDCDQHDCPAAVNMEVVPPGASGLDTCQACGKTLQQSTGIEVRAGTGEGQPAPPVEYRCRGEGRDRGGTGEGQGGTEEGQGEDRGGQERSEWNERSWGGEGVEAGHAWCGAMV